MQTEKVSVVSIHPDPARPLALDIKHILAALGARVQEWRWRVRQLDWLGENTETVCREVNAAAPAGLWMTSQELLDEARKVYQTVEGEFVAFPREVDPEAASVKEETLREFPGGKAALAIVAVDGGFFDIYTKESDVLTSLKVFKDVREEDPNLYF